MSNPTAGTVTPAGASPARTSRWRLGIRGRLVLAFGGIAATTMVAGVVSLLALGDVERTLVQTTALSLPAMTGALELAAESAALSSLAPALAAARDEQQLAELAARIAAHESSIESRLAALARSTADAPRLARIEQASRELRDQFGRLRQQVTARLQQWARRQMVVEQIGGVHQALLAEVAPLIDDAYFELVIEAADLAGAVGDTVQGQVDEAGGELRAALAQLAAIDRLVGVVVEAAAAPDAAALAAARTRYEAIAGGAQDGADAALGALEQQLRELAEGPAGIFARRALELATIGRPAAAPPEVDQALALQQDALAAFAQVGERSLARLAGGGEGGGPAAGFDVVIEQGVGTLRAYLAIVAESNLIAGLETRAANEPDAAALQPLRERIEAAAHRLRESLAALEPTGAAAAGLQAGVEELLAFGEDEGSVVELRRHELAAVAEEQAIIRQSWALAGALGREVAELVEGARGQVDASTATATGGIARHRLLLGSLSGASILIALLVMVLYVQPRIVAPLKALATVIGRLAAGEKLAIPGAERHDELGELGRALGQIYDQGVAAARIRIALDNASTMLMLADADGRIIYLTETLRQGLVAGEAEIRKDLPDFDAGQLIGAPLDRFHKDPVRERALLAGLSGTHQARMRLGGRTFDIAASPVIDAARTRLGTVVEWRDRTAELRVQTEIDAVVGAVNRGDFGRRVDTAAAEGLLGEMAAKINQLAGTVDQATTDLAQMLEALARGDLSHAIRRDYQGRFGELKAHANATAAKLAEIVAEIQTASGEVRNAAAEIGAGSEDLSARTEQAASNLEQTAASMEQMSATVRQNADNAGEANGLAEKANQAAAHGGRVAGETVLAMSRIEESSRKIADIVGVIDEIAFQTNLLALNASVEAARAGEAGKGFAVVAAEVRTLAQRSAEAASDIKKLIKDSGSQVRSGVEQVKRVGEALQEILAAIGSAAAIIAEISTASREQASGIEQINAAITQMDEMTQQNSALVEQSTAAARGLGDQATRLTELMTFFKLARTSATAPPLPPAARPGAAPRRPDPPGRKAPALAGGPPADQDGWSEF